MEQNSQEPGPEKTGGKSGAMTWIVVAVVIIVIAVVYFSRGGYKTPKTPASTPTQTPASSSSQKQTPSEVPAAAESTPQAGAAAVAIQNFAFSPASLKIKKGETVTWTNEDSAPHQIASDTNVFSGKTISKGQAYSFTFDQTGTFPYHCTIHPTMKGTISVE